MGKDNKEQNASSLDQKPLNSLYQKPLDQIKAIARLETLQEVTKVLCIHCADGVPITIDDTDIAHGHVHIIKDMLYAGCDAYPIHYLIAQSKPIV